MYGTVQHSLVFPRRYHFLLPFSQLLLAVICRLIRRKIIYSFVLWDFIMSCNLSGNINAFPVFSRKRNMR